jgi:hypothetical protein
MQGFACGGAIEKRTEERRYRFVACFRIALRAPT